MNDTFDAAIVERNAASIPPASSTSARARTTVATATTMTVRMWTMSTMRMQPNESG